MGSMRLQAYQLFEIVAWPALVWCALESTLRIAVGDNSGLGSALFIAACAAATIAAARSRGRSLAAAVATVNR